MTGCKDTVEIKGRVYVCDRIEEHGEWEKHRGKDEDISDDGVKVEVTVEWD